MKITLNQKPLEVRFKRALKLVMAAALALAVSSCGGGNSTPMNPGVAPTIVTQPANQSVPTGQAATFTVVATGTGPLNYQWEKNGVAISGATTATYATPPATTADDGSQFDVVVSNSVRAITSNRVLLTVISVSAPVITTQPASQTVNAGQTATFAVVASGTAPLSYQWLKNGTVVPGATSASYTTPPTTTGDDGSQFDVVVSNSVLAISSNTVLLTVISAPAIVTQPTSQTVNAGQTATFVVVASGTAPLSYQWQKNGTVVPGATSASYTTPPTTTGDDGSQFDVVVSNSVLAISSNTVLLTVISAPAIVTQPTSQTVNAGQTATFVVVASGTAPLSYQWQKNGTVVPGATSASYTTPPTTTGDDGSQFDVVVSNSVLAISSNTVLLTVISAPAIVTQPTSQTVNAGQTATFVVVASGTAPLSYQWQKNGTVVPGATSASYTTPPTTTGDDGSQFDVVVSNSVLAISSNTVLLTVISAPAIVTQPTSQTVNAGQTATFVVVASGTAPLSYQWQKNGTVVPGATSASYTTPPTTTGDDGSQFDVVVSNSVLAISSNTVLLTVISAPAIVTQPTSQTVNAGQTATFVVVASGTAPLSYQWQ